VQAIFFQTLYGFFVVDHASRAVLRVETTRHPTAAWASRQIVECCGWDQEPPRFLIHDRDGRYGALFDQRVRRLGITQIRAPFRSPQANSIAERWVRSLRGECLDQVFIFNERHLRAVLAEYIQYFNRWRPHRAIGQRAHPPIREARHREIIGEPVLGGLHHVYHLAT
jgi:transposase InsO family protein